MGDLKNLDHLRGRIADIIEWKTSPSPAATATSR